MNGMKMFAGAALVAGLAIIPVAAQKFHGEARSHAEIQQHFFARMTAVLSLSDAQQAAAKQLFESTHQQAEPVLADMKQVHAEMQTAVKANDTGAIRTLAARQGQLAGQLAELHGRAFAAFYAQLTPEQKTKADELKDHMHSGAMRALMHGGTR